MLERLNGNEKGDAIVSVRGYEPIWTKFTPSYELADVYFSAGKADISKREARLFEKREYVFDIIDGNILKEEDRVLDGIERREMQEREEEANAEAERLNSLDEQWQKTKDEIAARVQQFAELLDDKDAVALLGARLEDKATVLYMLMTNYNQTFALKMKNLAEYLTDEALPKLASLQKQATKK